MRFVILEKAGLRTGTKGALCLSRRMETDIAGVYAAGDCVETWRRLLGAYTYLPLGVGAQMLGHWQAEVAKRIDVYATALSHAMEVEGLNDLDLSYTPPFSSPWDPVQMAAQAWAAQRHRSPPEQTKKR